jgi:glucan phosphoethanolaminetransferase (alkaline phosphatase superfamily)
LAGAAWHLVLNTIAAFVLLSVLTTHGFPNLATCLAVLKTDAGEASHMLWATRHLVAAAACAWLVQLIGCISLARRAPNLAISASRWRILGLLPLTVPMVAAPVAQMYPAQMFDLFLKVHQYRQAGDRVNQAYPLKVQPRAGRDTAQSAELVVFVIGESSQADYWQLYGYPEASTPAMVKRNNAGELVVFKRHMATAGATRLAVPSLLSPFADLLPPPDGYRPSLVTLMGKAGYDTAWLSVQGLLPQAAEAQQTLFTSDAEVLGDIGKYDDRLLSQAAEWTRQHSTRPGFLVLHTAGSHLPYEARYPATAARWHDHVGKSFPMSQTVGNYLNTVLYTDTFLNSLMTQLSRENRPVLLVYLSDHGEANMKGLSRDQVKLEMVMHVPFLVWGNAQWRQAHQNEWAAAQVAAATGNVSNHLNVVPSLTSMLQLDYDGKPFKKDLLSPSFMPWKRTPLVRAQTMEVLVVEPPK